MTLVIVGKQKNVEPDALKEWKTYIFVIIDTRISFCSHITHHLNLFFCHLSTRYPGFSY